MKWVAALVLACFVLPLPAAPATNPNERGQPDIESLKKQVESAEAAVQRAKAKAKAEWEESPDYISMKKTLDERRTALDRARQGEDAKTKLDASAAYNEVRLKLEAATNARISSAGKAEQQVLEADETQLRTAQAGLEKKRIDEINKNKQTTHESRRALRTHTLSIIQRGTQIDAAIEKYIKSHDVPDDIQKGLWAGKPALGMNIDQLKLIGNLAITFESEKIKSYKMIPFETEDFVDPPELTIHLREGKVDAISYP